MEGNLALAPSSVLSCLSLSLPLSLSTSPPFISRSTRELHSWNSNTPSDPLPFSCHIFRGSIVTERGRIRSYHLLIVCDFVIIFSPSDPSFIFPLLFPFYLVCSALPWLHSFFDLLLFILRIFPKPQYEPCKISHLIFYVDSLLEIVLFENDKKSIIGNL